MPKYFAGKATLLNPGESFVAFNAEAYTSGTVPQLSAAICLGPSVGQNQPSISVEITYSGAPGVFSAQVQEASTDTGNNYITNPAAGATITAVSANQVARVNLSVGGPFVAILLASLTNSVNVTVVIRRTS